MLITILGALLAIPPPSVIFKVPRTPLATVIRDQVCATAIRHAQTYGVWHAGAELKAS